MSKIVPIILALMLICNTSAPFLKKFDPQETVAALSPPNDISVYTTHDPIKINNDTDFFTQANSEGWAGDGSPGDPYIIYNYEIDGAGNHTGIFIGNTTVHFVIQGCYVHNLSYVSDPYFRGAGIAFYNVINGVILDSVVKETYNGVYLANSQGIEITNNTVENSQNHQILLQNGASNNTVQNNTITNGAAFGLSVSDNSNDNIVFRNLFDSNDLSIAFSSGNIVDDNEFSNCDRAIRIRNMDAMLINNYIINSNTGLYAYESTVEIHDNQINSVTTGIDLQGVKSNSQIYNNTVENFVTYGLNVHAGANNLTIHHNTVKDSLGVSNSPVGIHVINSNDIEISNNTVSDVHAQAGSFGTDGGDVFGIYFYGTRNNKYIYNTVENIYGGDGGDGTAGVSYGENGNHGGKGGNATGIHHPYHDEYNEISFNIVRNIFGGVGGRGGDGADADIYGGDGGDGGHGNDGGYAYGINDGGDHDTIEGNSIYNIKGGNAGNGGIGGIGYGSMYGGGWGGDGGNGNKATGILLRRYMVTIPGQNNCDLLNNDIYNITSGDGGDGGNGGDGMDGAWGGDGGGGWDSMYARGIHIDGRSVRSENIHIIGNTVDDIQNGSAGSGGTGGYSIDYSGSDGWDGASWIPLGVYIYHSNINDVRENTISNITYGEGIHLGSLENTTIWHNDFVDNNLHAYSEESSSTKNNNWDGGYPEGGNYWDDYTGVDDYSGPGQNEPGSDGIGDTEYYQPSSDDIYDYYPLMKKYQERPKVTSTMPANGAVDVPLNQNVVVVFDTSMDTTHTPTLTQTSGSAVSYSFAGWSTTNTADDTATWTHGDWSGANDEIIELTVSDYRDTDQYYGSSYRWDFSTVDITNPEVINTNPQQGESVTDALAYVAVDFNESMNTSIQPTLTQTAGVVVNYNFMGWLDDNTARWSHDEWMDRDEITLEVDNAYDTSGNALTAPYSWNFTTEDNLRPKVKTTTPGYDATNVNRSVDVVIVFSEDMNTSVVPTLTQTAGTDPGGWIFLGWSNTNTENDTTTWSHNDWTTEGSVTLEVSNYEDAYGRTGFAHSWSFTIEDWNVEVRETIPADGTIDVVENVSVSVTFYESMDTSVTPTLTQETGDVVTYTFSGWSSKYENNDTAIWTHSTAWTSNDQIQLNVSGHKDLKGNIGTPYIWSFETGDTIKPYVIETVPADGATNVYPGIDIRIVYSESMYFEGQVKIILGNQGGVTFLGWETTYVRNDTAVWNHTAWDEKTPIEIKNELYRDEEDNQGDIYVWSFETGDYTAPGIKSTDPSDGAHVSYDKEITVIFNEPMNTSWVPTITQHDGDVVNYTFSGWSTTYVANDTAIWTHLTNWTDSDKITLEISDYHDDSNNMGGPYNWTFHIVDNTAPYVISTSPADNQTGVSWDLEQIIIIFSEEMDGYSTPEIHNFASEAVTYNFYRLETTFVNNDTVVFNVSASFTGNSDGHVGIYTGAGFEDLMGHTEIQYSWLFHLVDDTPPEVYEVQPMENGDANMDALVKVTYNETSIASYTGGWTYYFMNTSVIPIITQLYDDPGGWTFVNWSTDVNDRYVATWSHNNWNSDQVTLEVSNYEDVSGNVGSAFEWTFNVDIYTMHSMFRINSNVEMENMASSEGWPGDGSALNPYIIQRYHIAGDDPDGGYCIYIGNTTHNFIITQNKLEYAWTDFPSEPYYPNAAVVLYNVMGGTVENNRMNVGGHYGVYTELAEGTVIRDNTIKDASTGMKIFNSFRVSIEDNLITVGEFFPYINGLYILGSDECVIIGNNLTYGQDHGITLEESSYNIVSWNTIVNFASGLSLDPGDVGTTYNTTIENNTFWKCGLNIWGWLYEHWSSQKVVNNTVNGLPLLYLYDRWDIEIGMYERAGQIYLVDCWNITVSWQLLDNATVGLYIVMSDQIYVHNSTFRNNMKGIWMTETVGCHNTFVHNNFMNNYMHVDGRYNGEGNRWNKSYPMGGNYWGDYAGVDEYSGPGQDISGSDGIGDSNYTVYFDPGHGLSEQPTNITDEYPLMEPTNVYINVSAGLNFISLPWQEEPIDIESVLSGALWDKAWAYTDGEWHTFVKDRAPHFNLGFPEIDNTIGIWVNLLQGGVINGPNLRDRATNITLIPGWNVVGYPSITDRYANETLPAEVSKIGIFNLSREYNMEYVYKKDFSNYTMSLGQGYMIYNAANYDVNWTVVWDEDYYSGNSEPSPIIMMDDTRSTGDESIEQSGISSIDMAKVISAPLKYNLAVMLLILAIVLIYIRKKHGFEA